MLVLRLSGRLRQFHCSIDSFSVSKLLLILFIVLRFRIPCLKRIHYFCHRYSAAVVWLRRKIYDRLNIKIACRVYVVLKVYLIARPSRLSVTKLTKHGAVEWKLLLKFWIHFWLFLNIINQLGDPKPWQKF